jgi:chromosome segregation ATPase
LNDEKREHATQIERLRAQVKSLLQGKDALTNQLEASKGESAAKDHKLELLKSKAKRADELDKLLKAATAQIEKMKSHMSMVGAEKESLAALIAQKESLLKIQGRQSDMSMKLLRQRQERLDSKDGDAFPGADSADSNPISRIAGVDDFDSLNQSLLKQLEVYKTDIVVLTAERDALASVVNKQLASRQQQQQQVPPSAAGPATGDEVDGGTKQYEQYAEKLQRNLHDLFSREGELIYKELVDTQKLTSIIRDLRRQLSDSELLVSAADLDKDVMSTVQKQLTDAKTELHAEKVTRQALELKLMAAQQELQTAAQSPQQLLEVMRNQHMQLQAENSSLKDQMVRYQSEIGNAQTEALRLKESMQLEYNALWQSVQDLNRLDEQKDRSIKDILRDRDLAVADKTRAFETLAAISMENSQLKQELEVSAPCSLPRHAYHTAS